MNNMIIQDNEFVVGGEIGRYLRLNRKEDETAAFILCASVLNIELGKDAVHINTTYRRYTIANASDPYQRSIAILDIIVPVEVISPPMPE